MSIRAFSAQRFYALATGLPVDSAQALVGLDMEMPREGLLMVAPDPRGDNELLWIQGVAAVGEQRERFIDEIRAGKIPTPLQSSDTNGMYSTVRYYPLESLHSREQTIAGFLGYTEPIVALARTSRCARCPTCSQLLPLFHTAREVCNQVLATHQDRDCRIELTGPPEEVSAWAGSHGFTPSASVGGRASVRIDSFTCSANALRNIEQLLTSTKQLPDSWLTIHHDEGCDEYGWNGRCRRCDLSLQPFNSASARDFIQRPTSSRPSHEQHRIVGGVSLGELLSFSFGRLLESPSGGDFCNPLQREIVASLSLENLTLHTQTTDLAPHTLASVALLALARDEERLGTLRLYTAPASLFSADNIGVVKTVLDALSRRSGFVWLTDDRPFTKPRPLPPPHSGNGRHLATVALDATPSIDVEAHIGQWTEVSAPPSLRHLRVGAFIYESLSGKPHRLASCTVDAPFTPVFVPLFPSESSGTRLVAHALGVIEPLAKMFAASHQAKMLGLGPREFLLGQLRQSATICTSCKGVGLLILKEGRYPNVEPCHSCWGARFRTPTREISFKGRTLWEILNAPLSTAQETLRALPRMKEVLDLASLLKVADLPLGMPTMLLSTPQRRLIAIAHAVLTGTKTRPSLIVVEEPFVGLSAEQQAGLESVIGQAAFADRISWIGVTSS